MQILEARGANLAAIDFNGCTPLHIAASEGMNDACTRPLTDRALCGYQISVSSLAIRVSSCQKQRRLLHRMFRNSLDEAQGETAADMARRMNKTNTHSYLTNIEAERLARAIFHALT